MLKKSKVLSKVEVQSLLDSAGSNTERSLNVWADLERKNFFFTTEYRLPESVPKCNDLVPAIVGFPIHVTPRPGLESGIVATLDEYIFVFHYDEVLLDSLTEVESAYWIDEAEVLDE